MKKKSTSQSAFFNLRVLIGLLVVAVGACVALASSGVFSITAASLDRALRKNQIITSSSDPLVPVGFDCSTIHQLGIDKMENFRAGAIMVACGEESGGSPNTRAGGPISRFIQKLVAPLLYGGTDVDLITGTETSPNITQSETYSMANPDNPQQVVVAYNDSRGRNASPINISGVSVSTDGGGTFNRLTLAGGQGPFVNTEGDPVLLYHRPTSTWLTVWIGDGQCSGGLGGYKSTTPEVATSWTHYPCVNSSGGANDDRESGWSDVNPASPHYGTLYVSWNNFGLAGPPISVTRSTDGGNTWSAGVNLPIPSGASFIRDVQITGDYTNGDVYVAGMDENNGSGCTAGCGSTRRNVIYRSTDGGATFANTYTGPTFVGACRSASGYFCTMYDNPAYWRHMSWGEPAAFNHIVSLVYAEKDGADAGNVYYIRSTDSGATFSAPFQLNSNTDATKAQWQPNISVSPTGTLLATWYDETPRTTASCQPSSPTNLCYQMHSNKSNDNGVTWQGDLTFSDVASPLPLQPDPGIVAVYVGDYDYGSASAAKHVTSWADGRVAIGGASQQDAFTDRELVGFAITSTNPACNSIVSTQTTDFIINLSDAVNPATVQPTDFTVNGIPANSDIIAAGNQQITFHFNSSPVTTQGTQTMNIPANAFNRTSDNMGNFAFNCTFCYAATPLQVTSTVPAVGGTFTPPAPGNYSYDVIFNQNIDAASVSTSDLTLAGNVGGSVTSVTVSGNTAHFMVHFNFGGNVTASIAAGAITAGGCNSNAAFTGNYTVAGCSPSWSAGPNLPTVLIRAVGVYFPADGNFYTMGGRTADTAGSDFQHVLRYSPVSNTWTQMGVTLPDNTMNNMACGVLTVSGTPYIYCVGGSAATQTTATPRVFFYNPATDTATTLAAGDNWPGDSAGTILPGGFAVTGNKMYILGGFNINVASTNQIYSFDPTAGVGSKWTLAPVTTPVGIMYAPTCAIGGIIYVGGASDYQGGTVVDTTTSFSFTPPNTIGTIATIPRATGETRGLNFNGNMYVMGGGRVAPNPSTEVDVYNPGTNSWSIGTPFVTPRRNFPTDTNGTDHIWLGGGYATDGVTPMNTMEIFQCLSPLSITSAVSRKTHGTAGNFDVNMPLSGPTGVEDRNTGGTHDYTLVVTFSQNVSVTGSPQAQVTSGTGCVGTGGVCSGTVSVSGAVVTVPLTNIADQQNINVRINGVNSSGNFNIPMGFLTGDTNGNRTVNAADVAQTKSQLGQPVGASNFRTDVNANGTINAADTALVKQNSGHSLP